MLNVVPFKTVSAQSATQFLANVDDAIKRLTELRKDVKGIVIVLDVGDDSLHTWLGPSAEFVSYATDFVKAIMQENMRREYGL